MTFSVTLKSDLCDFFARPVFAAANDMTIVWSTAVFDSLALCCNPKCRSHTCDGRSILRTLDREGASRQPL